jgi:prophage tail gpP-like protein
MALQLTTNSWRDKDGMLWQPNARVSVDLPILRYGDLNWVIGTVTFKRNLQSGTTADLVLYPPEAFSVEPLSLSPADADRVTAIRQAQDQDAHRVSVETEGMDATPQPTTTETPIS